MLTNIKFLDTTLRDGDQTPGVTLTPEKKLWMARKLDELRVDIIEAGSAVISDGERKAIRAIASEGLDAEICSYCRVIKQDIDYALDCGVDSIHLVVPVSDLHINVKLKKDKDTVRKMAIDCLEYAKDHGLIVELSGEDASRADINFLKSLYLAGIEAKADRLCFCDTVGLLVPEKTTEIFKDLTSIIKTPISIHCHDDFGLAVSNSIAALNAGAQEVHATINGIGERAGNASLEEIVMILEWLYKYKTKIQYNELYKTSRLVHRLTGVPVAPTKSLVGSNVFTHESGVHVHGLLASTSTYEPISPDVIGRERKIILGKHAGKSSIILALKELGFKVNEVQLQEILNRVKELGDSGKRVTDADLQSITEAVLDIHKKARVILEDLTVVSGNKIMPTASLKFNIDGKEVVEAGIGNGPVDAAINCIKKATHSISGIELEEYHVDAIEGGTDALVEVVVKLSKNGKTITSRGSRTDIIMASVEAMLNGINYLIANEANND